MCVVRGGGLDVVFYLLTFAARLDASGGRLGVAGFGLGHSALFGCWHSGWVDMVSEKSFG